MLLIDNLHLLGACHPFVYVWLILLLPIEIPRWAQLLIGATIGLAIDFTTGVLGVHMAATALIAYLRPLLLQGYVQDIERMRGPVTMPLLGLTSYIYLLITLIVVHHSLVFLLEAFTFRHLLYTLLQIVVSSIISLVFILLLEILRKNL